MPYRTECSQFICINKSEYDRMCLCAVQLDMGLTRPQPRVGTYLWCIKSAFIVCAVHELLNVAGNNSLKTAELENPH